YSLYPPVNTSGVLSFSEGSEPAQGYEMTANAEMFSIGTTNEVENFAWPAPTTVTATLEDANGNPMSNVTLNEGGEFVVQEYLADGTWVIVQIPYGNVPPSWDTSCTTDANGQCTFTALVGSNTNFSASTQLVPGDGNYPTVSADNGLIV